MTKNYPLTEVEYRLIQSCIAFKMQDDELNDKEKDFIKDVKDKLKDIHDTKTE